MRSYIPSLSFCSPLSGTCSVPQLIFSACTLRTPGTMPASRAQSRGMRRGAAASGGVRGLRHQISWEAARGRRHVRGCRRPAESAPQPRRPQKRRGSCSADPEERTAGEPSRPLWGAARHRRHRRRRRLSGWHAEPGALWAQPTAASGFSSIGSGAPLRLELRWSRGWWHGPEAAASEARPPSMASQQYVSWRLEAPPVAGRVGADLHLRLGPEFCSLRRTIRAHLPTRGVPIPNCVGRISTLPLPGQASRAVYG